MKYPWDSSRKNPDFKSRVESAILKASQSHQTHLECVDAASITPGSNLPGYHDETPDGWSDEGDNP